MKAVSLILQFAVFSIIGISFFFVVGNLLSFQSGSIKRDVIDHASNLTLSQVSAAAIASVSSCKSCEIATIKINQLGIAGYTPTYQLSNGIILEVEPESKAVSTSIHNLYHSVLYDADKTSSREISLTYDRTNNKLAIG